MSSLILEWRLPIIRGTSTIGQAGARDNGETENWRGSTRRIRGKAIGGEFDEAAIR